MRIAIIQHASDLSGSTISGGLVARGFRREDWDVHVLFNSDGPGVVRYRELGCHTHIIPHKNWLRRGGVRFVQDVLCERRTAQAFSALLRRLAPDVVYINSLVSVAAAIAAKRLGLPCIWHIRELFGDVGGEMRRPVWGGKALVSRTVRRLADTAIVISQAVGENVLGYRAGQESAIPVYVIPNAVEDSYFAFAPSSAECRARLELPATGVLIGIPGTLRPMKGHGFFLEAAARLVERLPHCHFAFTGDGEPNYVRSLQEQVTQLKITERVHFLGSLTDMPPFYRALDIACVPSVAEPFGRAVIEAFALGTPVVGTAVGGIREIIQHEQSGLLVPYGDVEALTRNLARISEDKTLRARCAQAARRAAEQCYSAQQYHHRINGVVQQVLQPAA